jgi:hypothetical protein
VTGSSKNRIFQPAGGFLIGGFHQVGIDVQGDGGGGVPELGLDVFDVFPILHSEAGVGMAEIVKPNKWTARGLERGAKMPAQHILVVDIVPCVVREDQVQVGFCAG